MLHNLEKSFSEKVENIVGKGENNGYQHFSPFPTMFSKAFVRWGRLKSGLCGKRLKHEKKMQTLNGLLFEKIN